MTLYTSKVVAQWLCLTERRVRQLRDEGVIVEARPGLYELQPTVARYITYIGGAGKETLTNERMMLTRAKREAAEMENDLRRGEVHRTADIERGIQSMFLNIRSRFLALPAKLSPTLSTMGGDQTGIFDELKGAIEEILEEMSDYRVAFAAEDGEDDGEADKETPSSGCVWRVQTSEDKVLCMFPRCVRKEYERYWPQGKQSDEKAKDH